MSDDDKLRAEIERLHRTITQLMIDRGFYENEIDARRLIPVGDITHIRAALKEAIGIARDALDLAVDYGAGKIGADDRRDRLDKLEALLITSAEIQAEAVKK